MRHRKEGKKFNRKTGARRSFLRNLVGDVVRHGKIETTAARAKALRPLVEHLVTIAKRGDLASRRILLRRLHNKNVVERLLDEVGPRYADRKGGYMRVLKLGKTRKRDGVRLARLEFV